MAGVVGGKLGRGELPARVGVEVLRRDLNRSEAGWAEWIPLTVQRAMPQRFLYVREEVATLVALFFNGNRRPIANHA